jgi:hypothetical protein
MFQLTRASSILFWVLIGFACLSCSRKSVGFLERKGIRVNEKALTAEAGTEAGEHSIRILYTGCGGLTIRRESEKQTIMIDPFFSHQRFMTIGRSLFVGGKIKSSPKQIAFGKKRVLDSLHLSTSALTLETQAIFAAHGHYDHLMDIPYLYQYWFDQQPDVYVNESSFNSIANLIKPQDLHNLDQAMSVRDLQGKSIDLPAIDGSVTKVYPILAAHNPHMKNIKLFSGSLMRPPSKFRKPSDKTSVHQWLEGRTLSFLIDIEKGGEIVFRMFIQSSSAHYPDGMPPADLLSRKKVDLAVLGIASYHFSEATYPCAYMEQMQPRHIMFIHWEDFFRKYGRRPRTVLKNNVARFFTDILPACNDGRYILPAPGVVVNVKY